MIDDPLHLISKEIQSILCPSELDPSTVIKLIDKTISFPTSAKIWRQHFKNNQPSQILEEIETPEGKAKFIEHLKCVTFPVKTVSIEKERCVLSFNRLEITKFLFQEILRGKTTFGRSIKVNKKRIQLLEVDKCDYEILNNYRVKLVHGCLEKIVQYVDFQEEWVDFLKVSGNSSKIEGPSVKCGLVVEPKTKKVCDMSSSEYIEMRSTDMRLIAMHKYGMRIKDDVKFKEMIQKLGLAAVAVDLLEVKHTSPVQINRKGQGSTKGE